jgi:DNA primase
LNGEQNGMILETMEQHTSLHDEAPQGASFDYSFVDTVGRIALYDDLRSAMAEEGVIRLLMQDDSLFPDQPPLREDEFSSPLLGRIYGELWRCRGSGSSMAALSASLTPEEMSHLTTLLQKPESTANAPQALADYIRIIREEGVKRSGRSAMDALAAARDTYKDKKGYGGKRT